MDKTTEKRIEADAHKYLDELSRNLLNRSEQVDIYNGYIAGATAEHSRLQPVIDALAQFIARHEGGLLPDRFTYEKGVKALEQCNGTGKEVADPCPHCGKELSRDRNLCCRECGKEVDNV